MPGVVADTTGGETVKVSDGRFAGWVLGFPVRASDRPPVPGHDIAFGTVVRVRSGFTHSLGVRHSRVRHCGHLPPECGSPSVVFANSGSTFRRWSQSEAVFNGRFELQRLGWKWRCWRTSYSRSQMPNWVMGSASPPITRLHLLCGTHQLPLRSLPLRRWFQIHCRMWHPLFLLRTLRGSRPPAACSYLTNTELHRHAHPTCTPQHVAACCVRCSGLLYCCYSSQSLYRRSRARIPSTKLAILQFATDRRVRICVHLLVHPCYAR